MRVDDDVVAAVRVLLDRSDPKTMDVGAFLGAAYDAGLSWVHFPPGLGGLGASRAYQGTVDRMLREAGAPSGFRHNPIGYGMAAPTLVEHGDRALATGWLRALATGEHIWCQLFSESSAGSDLAGLATAAVRDGDEWVVNGHKVWTSYAHRARWGLLLARTDPALPKHAGLTYFVVDMHAPGVEVRPLRQMTGEAEFNEVYLTEVKIRDRHRLGAVGAGWRVAATTLSNERTSIGGSGFLGGDGDIGVLLDLWGRHPDQRSPVLGEQLARTWVEAQALRLVAAQQRATTPGGTPGPEGSATKLVGAELNQRVFDLAMELLGPEAALYDTYDEAPGPTEHSIQRQFLRSRANTIEGGTSDVLRNIIAERVLGLPREPRTDTALAWKDVPRG